MGLETMSAGRQMIRQRRWRFIAVVICFASGLRIGPVKADVQVNTYTTGLQGGPSVAMAANGDFVVVFTSLPSPGTDNSDFSIQGQRYASDGSAVGGQFQVNTYTDGSQFAASVAMNAGGDFVIVWESDGSYGTDSWFRSIQGQRYASDGSTVGAQFQVNTYTQAQQRFPSVALSTNGDFFVVWESEGSYGTDSDLHSVQGQRYASDGSTLGSEFQVNTYTTRVQRRPSVASDLDGNFVVVWSSGGSAGPDTIFYRVAGQRYASDGSTLGGEFQVNSYTEAPQVFPSVAMGLDGDFAVVWASEGSYGTDSSRRSVQGRRFASDGSAVSRVFQVNTYTTRDQAFPSVAMDAVGDFVVAWESFGSSGTDTFRYSIQGQRYASDGATVGGEFQINTYTPNDQDQPSVVLDLDGNFVVAWISEGSGGTDSSYTSVQMRMALIFANGFESGDASAWSSVVGMD